MNEDTDFWRMSPPKEPLSIKKSVDDLQPIPTNSNIQKKCSMNFETNTLREHQNMETDDPLRNMRNSRSFAVDTSLAARSRVSFKDFEIKPDSVVVNESLSTVGLDDSDILKAGLNDMTCPEGVPSICMSMTDVTSPCSKSRMSLADKNTLLNSSTQEIQQCEHPTLVKSFQPDFGGVKPRTDHLDAHDEDTSVSVPFVFKSLPEKRKSEAPKLGQSFPVIEFDESPNRPGVSLPQRTSVATNIPAAKKSIDPKKFYSNQEANDQDTSISVPFVFKAVTDASSNALKLRQSFPVIECGEGQSSAQMELTEVAQTVEPRKSLARTNLDFDGNSLQPSYSSGQMELTDVVAVNRKSISSASPTVSPQDTSGIEMDETLQKVKSCDEVKAPETLTSLSVGLTTTCCDMEETNVKQKNTENPRKSFFSSNHSPLSLTSEETITKPITSSIACVGDTVSKSCVDDEETVAKSSLMNLEVSRKELSSSGVIDIDMEQTNVNHQIRVSVGHNKKKSFESTRDSVPVDVEQEIARKSTGIAVDVPVDYQGELKSLDRKSGFFSAARLSCRKSGLGKGSDSVPVDVEQEIARKSTGITVDVAADYQGELKSLDRKSGFFSAARLSCRKSGLGKGSDSVPVDVEQEIARKSTGITVDVAADYQGELKSLDRKSGFFSAARLSCRKSGLGKGSDSVPVDVEQEIARKSTGITVDVAADYQGELKSLDRKSGFFSAARLSCRKSGLGKESDSVPVDVEQEIARKSTGITVNVLADYQGELKSLDRKSGFFSAARLSCRKSVLGKESDSVPAGDSNVEEILRMRVSLGETNSNVQNESGVVDESTGVQIPSNNVEVDCLGEASSVNRKSGFFPSTARISRRESDFDPLEDSCNAKQGFVDKSLGTVAMDDVSENESIGVQILPNKVNCIGELKSSCVNRKSGFFSSGARISRQESDFDPLEDDSNVKQGLVNKSFGRVAMDDFENESIGVEIPPKNVEVDCLGELKTSCVYRKSGFFSSAGRISRQESDFDSLEVNSNVKQDVVDKSIGGVAMDDVAEDESAEVVIPQEGQYQGELKSLNVDRKSGLFSSAAKLSYRKSGFGHAADSEVSSAPASQDGSPLGRLSSRKSGLVASQPREVCDERDNDVIPSENTSMELTSPDAGAIDDKHDSNAPLDMLKTEDLHEDRVPTTNTRLSRKSVRFINSPAEEDNDVRCHDITNPEVYVTPDSMSTDGCTELNSYGFEENENPLPRRASRKSCIGIPVVTDADEEENHKSTSDVQSGETEFAIRRNSRKSTIGARQSRNYIEFDSPSPEDCDKVDVTPTHAEERILPVSELVDKEALNAAEDIDLSQNMMNISLNDGEFDESETGKLNATSTPCKPLASCSETQDRKRNRSGTARNPSLASDLVHNLSQEVMNISIQSDTRSPLPKKSSTGMRKSKGLSLKGEASCVELNLCETGSAEFENTGLLEYETRLANRELMKRLGFNLLGSQTCWETLLYDKVLGIKVVLPSTRFTEFTRIYSIEYTFYSWRIGRTLFLDRETVEFIRNRLHRHMPKEWLREKCNTIGDLFKTVSALKKEMEMLKPLIQQLSYVKSRRPCTISNDRISFKIVNLHAQVDCEVTVELKNSHKMSDCCITLKNNVGKLNLDTVRMVFQALPSSDVDVLFRFVKFLDSETSQLTLGA
ncbi:hypothetical protein GE061_012920 [Apolygus lucorum]|uniref:Uncharacterized protein n=1 Tax=Apolygus lucorum TaxID=248454 RepID=A0A8S9XVV6_APOLU|nr:hypothetical protein GE061_012920 [Apolygus lucorum]